MMGIIMATVAVLDKNAERRATGIIIRGIAAARDDGDPSTIARPLSMTPDSPMANAMGDNTARPKTLLLLRPEKS
jgi:hypothetical protein